MAVLPSAGSGETIGVLITTVADDGALKTTTAELQVLGDEAEKAGNKAGGSGKSGFDQFNSSLKTVGQQMTDVGKSLSTYITLPIVGIAAASTKMAMTFQQSMELLHTNAGIPQSQIKSLGDSILNLASQVGQKPDDLAQAFYHIATASQGIFTTSQMLDQLKVAAEGAAIGQANLDDTTYALTSTLAANIKGATDYNSTMGTLLGIVQAGDMHLSDMNAVIGTGLMGTLSTFGVSLQSAGAALADFGDLGEKGAAAGTRLRMMLTLMVSPSQAASKQLSALGLTASDAATATGTMSDVFAKTGLSTTKLADDLRQPNGISVAIHDLQTHLEDAGLSASQTDAILSKAFGGGRSDAALLQLLDTTGRLDIKYKQIGQDSGNFASNWQSQQQTMKEQWDKAWGGIQADMIKLGVVIMPEVTHAMTDVSHGVTDLTNWFSGLSKGQKQFVIDAAAVVAAVGPVLLIFGTLARSISSIITLGTTLAPVFTGAFSMISGGVTAMAGTVTAAGLTMAGVFVGLVADVYLVFKAIQDVIGAYAAVQQANAASKADSASIASAHQQIVSLSKTGTPDQKARASKLLSEGYATGTSNAPGGFAMTGENGPEAMYVPQGAQIYTNNQTRSMMANGQLGGGGVVLNQENNIYNQVDMTEANRELAWRLNTAVGA